MSDNVIFLLLLNLVYIRGKRILKNMNKKRVSELGECPTILTQNCCRKILVAFVLNF